MTAPVAAVSPHRGIPSLDGLRAISVALVCVQHAALMRLLPETLQRFTALETVGQLGVHMFFVLSGYLITSLLVRERERDGRIRFGAFYLRRTFRILPPYYVYLAVVACLGLGGLALGDHVRWWAAILYLTNVVDARSWYTGHGWSLSAEEQFYFVWPALLALGWARGGRRGAAVVAVAFFCFGPMMRLLALGPIARVLGFPLTAAYQQLTPFQTDYLAAGCLAALSPAFADRLSRRGVVVAIAAVATVALHPTFATSTTWTKAIGNIVFYPFQALTFTAVLVWCVRNPASAAGRVLNRRSMRTVGLVSYSLYLWQELWFAPWLRDRVAAGLSHGAALLLATLGTAMCATASYWLVERPSFALRDRVVRWVAGWTSTQPSAGSAA